MEEESQNGGSATPTKELAVAVAAGHKVEEEEPMVGPVPPRGKGKRPLHSDHSLPSAKRPLLTHPMNSSSLSLTSPPSSSFSRIWKHDVFPSFYGPDIRKTFLSHFLKEFRGKGIDLFIDNHITRDKSIGPEHVEAIRGSTIALVLLSKNYASSSWCLDELVEIMKCREVLRQIVLPIFYEVHPTDVKKQTGAFGKAFRNCCQGKTKEHDAIWREALEDVAQIAGEHSCNWEDEADMIKKIVTDVSNKLINSSSSRDFDNLVVMEARMERMGLLLRQDLDEIRMIGIRGPAGIGKSTIARVLSNQFSRRFQLGAIMDNIKACYPTTFLDEYSAKLQQQNQMLSQITDQTDIVISHLGVAQQWFGTDNSYWLRSGKFRLGAKETEGGVVEAITNAFVGKDHRGEGSQDITLDEESDSGEFSDVAEVYDPLYTCIASSTSTNYDVVIRYRRGDISNEDFISHLRAALCRRGISVHEDFDEVDTVPECSVLIIFLTTTYIPSNLSNLLEHQQTESRVIFPLFYETSPSELINNSKNYVLQDEQKKWQATLKKIARMPGYILTDKSEPELIDEIVGDAWEVLSSTDKENKIGMDMQIKDILSMLCMESLDVRSIGIWGTVGIGKTAIAEEIFRRISVQFETFVFLKDLHKEVEEKGQDVVREHFLSSVLEVKPRLIQFSDMKTSFLWSRLQRKKVLVILDNVIDFRDIETFLGELNYFGPGSRIIMTSRNRSGFVLCKINHVYEVKPLDTSKSLLLLGRGTSQSILLPELVKFSQGNPQVLQFLFKSVGEWKQLSQQIRETSPIYIQGVFERSCCGLDDNEKSIFLDIACFFRRMDKDNVAMLLDGCGFSAHVGFRSLVDKSLLTISHNLLDMISFIQATGREIVHQESDLPEYRSRLWNPEDIKNIFRHDKGTSAIEGIFLDMSKLKLDTNPIIFEKMCNLRLLKFYYSEVMEYRGVSLPQGLEYLPSNLRLLHWEYYPLSSLPKFFDPKNLVEVNLPSSCAKKLWKGKKSLENLRKMRLSYSYQLTKIPRLSSAPNLELLDLEGCNRLVSINQSICYLKKLVFLNLKDCSKLECIPSTVDLESLEVLNLSGCSKLENFPEISPNVKELYIGGTMIQEIPSSIKNLVLLEKLDLENSRHLKNFSTSICKLKHLETLNLSGCTSLERFPELSKRMKYLRFLDLSRTAVKELSSSISYLIALEELRLVDCKNLVRLPDNTWSLRFKVEFRQIDTEKFSKLWNRFGWLKKVQIS